MADSKIQNPLTAATKTLKYLIGIASAAATGYLLYKYLNSKTPAT
jgi:hypothetical protein